MRYIIYNLIDPVTGIALDPIMPAPNGRTHPNFKGLNVTFAVFHNDDKFVATIDDDATITIDPRIAELTVDQYNAAIEAEFNAVREDIRLDIYEQARQIREVIVSTWYHSSEISFAVSIKVIEAQAAMAAADDASANTAAPYLYMEAQVRGITTKALAQTVIDKFDGLRTDEAKCAGTRGLKTDQLDAVTFDAANPTTGFNSLDTIRQNIINGWN